MTANSSESIVSNDSEELRAVVVMQELLSRHRGYRLRKRAEVVSTPCHISRHTKSLRMERATMGREHAAGAVGQLECPAPCFCWIQTTPLPLLIHEEAAGPSDLKTRVKGWAKFALRSAGLFRRGWFVPIRRLSFSRQ